MDDFLTAVSTTAVKPTKEPEPIIEPTATKRNRRIKELNLHSPEEISNILKTQPSLESVDKILNHLATESRRTGGFSLVTPGPVQAQIVDTLVRNIIPDYWRTLIEAGKLQNLLVECLQNANGIGAILGRLRPLIADCRQTKPVDNTRDASEHIIELLDVLDRILSDDGVSSQIWVSIQTHAQNPIQKTLMWKEYVLQIASGKILSLVAEAEDVIKERGSPGKTYWCGNGKEYASWLGRNIAVLLRRNVDVEDFMVAVTELCGKVLSLGYLGTNLAYCMILLH
jgi:telomere length regulation protein